MAHCDVILTFCNFILNTLNIFALSIKCLHITFGSSMLCIYWSDTPTHPLKFSAKASGCRIFFGQLWGGGGGGYVMLIKFSCQTLGWWWWGVVQHDIPPHHHHPINNLYNAL